MKKKLSEEDSIKQAMDEDFDRVEKIVKTRNFSEYSEYAPILAELRKERFVHPTTHVEYQSSPIHKDRTPIQKRLEKEVTNGIGIPSWCHILHRNYVAEKVGDTEYGLQKSLLHQEIDTATEKDKGGNFERIRKKNKWMTESNIGTPKYNREDVFPLRDMQEQKYTWNQKEAVKYFEMLSNDDSPKDIYGQMNK
jgi:hypothetical protein